MKPAGTHSRFPEAGAALPLHTYTLHYPPVTGAASSAPVTRRSRAGALPAPASHPLPHGRPLSAASPPRHRLPLPAAGPGAAGADPSSWAGPGRAQLPDSPASRAGDAPLLPPTALWKRRGFSPGRPSRPLTMAPGQAGGESRGSGARQPQPRSLSRGPGLSTAERRPPTWDEPLTSEGRRATARPDCVAFFPQ